MLFIFIVGFLWILPAKSMFAQESDNGLTVFAAASLSDAFHSMAKHFEEKDPGGNIEFNFAGSQQLAQQIGQGAPVDIFASANMKQMAEAMKSGRIDSASVKIFAHNRLVVVFPKGHNGPVRALNDLTAPGLKIVLADKAVPVGQYALEFLDRCDRSASFNPMFKDSVLRNVVSYEENVKAVLSKVMLGEADAGIVYFSDVTQSALTEAGMIDIPDDLNVIASYPIAVISDSKHLARAKKFAEYILSDEGQQILAQSSLLPVNTTPTPR
ncbi:MAG TPA: molybdate ABC transporter substrate-binding protein [Bacteroidota bacterium]|nr:molybdate ABC transporter substrate-binding protein [Bacteroidota bacterium]